MAASNRSSLSNPFGYTFPSYPANNNPPSGPPLLDQEESTSLQTFFSDPDHFQNADGLVDHALTNLTAGQDSRLSLLPESQWLYPPDQPFTTPFPEQDPTFPTHPQSFTQRATHLAGSPEDVLTLVGIPTNGTPPDDVLHAASTLFMYRANQLPDQNALSNMFTPRRQSTQPPPTARHASFSYNTPSAPNNLQQYPPLNGQFRAPFDGATNHVQPSPHTHAHPPMYQFGSDNNFRHNGYSAPYEGLEDATQTHIDFVRGMVSHSNGGVSSVDNSVPQTPEMTRTDNKFYQAPPHVFAEQVAQRPNPQHSEKPKQKKRRKKKQLGEQFDVDRKIQPTSPTFNQNSSPDEDNDNAIAEASPDGDADGDEDATAGAPKRRRASSSANGKSGSLSRKNLTEEQKRSNHIRSEQKRRNIIKQGYADLKDLVPNLKTGGFSKSAVLTETTRFLEELQTGNDRMEAYLRQLAAQNGLPFDS